MAKRRRYLVLTDLADAGFAENAERFRQALAACPEAAAYSDEESEAFLMVAAAFDWMEEVELGGLIRSIGISHPPELMYDAYRLSRYFFRRWGDQALREKLSKEIVSLHPAAVAKFRRRDGVSHAREMVQNLALAPGLAILRRSKLDDLAAAVLEGFTPWQQAKYEAQLIYGKVRMHQLMTEPEPARTPTRWEQAKVKRRLSLHDVQIHTLGRSLRSLRGERKALLNRIRAVQRQDEPELLRLAAQMEAVHQEREATEARHAEALAEQARQFEGALAALRTQAAVTGDGYQRALALRNRLLVPSGGDGNG
ncbi:MAG: hypothetical protein K0R39_2131 [Symbiobacteriaceae bacterium]|nr:hypothetical protein [Symbiobacteriaceae bacterium]